MFCAIYISSIVIAVPIVPRIVCAVKGTRLSPRKPNIPAVGGVAVVGALYLAWFKGDGIHRTLTLYQRVALDDAVPAVEVHGIHPRLLVLLHVVEAYAGDAGLEERTDGVRSVLAEPFFHRRDVAAAEIKIAAQLHPFVVAKLCIQRHRVGDIEICLIHTLVIPALVFLGVRPLGLELVGGEVEAGAVKPPSGLPEVKLIEAG